MRFLTQRDFFFLVLVGFCKSALHSGVQRQPACRAVPCRAMRWRLARRSPSLGRAADSLLDTGLTSWHRPQVKCFSSRAQSHASRSALDNQFRMSILERLEQMERRMAEMTGSQQHKQASSGGGGSGGSSSGSGSGGGQAQVGPGVGGCSLGLLRVSSVHEAPGPGVPPTAAPDVTHRC